MGVRAFFCSSRKSFRSISSMVCRGERDRTGTIARHMEDWKRAWPETETAVLPGAAHVVNLDAPEAFNRLLLDFLTRCGGSRR